MRSYHNLVGSVEASIARRGGKARAPLGSHTTAGVELPMQAGRDDARRRLVIRADEVRADLAASDRELGHIMSARADSAAADDEHDPEGSTVTSDWSLVAGMRADALEQQTEIVAAIARLDAGTYGMCLSCQRPISKERLEARPAASLCIGCARVRE